MFEKKYTLDEIREAIANSTAEMINELVKTATEDGHEIDGMFYIIFSAYSSMLGSKVLNYLKKD